jgi:hypothetical protein
MLQPLPSARVNPLSRLSSHKLHPVPVEATPGRPRGPAHGQRPVPQRTAGTTLNDLAWAVAHQSSAVGPTRCWAVFSSPASLLGQDHLAMDQGSRPPIRTLGRLAAAMTVTRAQFAERAVRVLACAGPGGTSSPVQTLRGEGEAFRPTIVPAPRFTRTRRKYLGVAKRLEHGPSTGRVSGRSEVATEYISRLTANVLPAKYQVSRESIRKFLGRKERTSPRSATGTKDRLRPDRAPEVTYRPWNYPRDAILLVESRQATGGTCAADVGHRVHYQRNSARVNTEARSAYHDFALGGTSQERRCACP